MQKVVAAYLKANHPHKYLLEQERDKLADLQVELGAEPVQIHRRRKSWQAICNARGRVKDLCRECSIGILLVRETILSVRSPDFILASETA